MLQGDKMPDFSDSCNNILKYGGIADADIAKISSRINQFAAMSDQGASGDDARRLRKELTAYYYEIYKRVFFKSLEDSRIPDEVLMFLYFGYIDEKLAGADNTRILYEATRSMGLDEELRIFTFYQWLRLVYMCKKDPSVNDFSTDYITTIRKQKREGSLTDAQEKEALVNGRARVEFEIDNMFKSANRMMSSRITTFVPFFFGADSDKTA